MASTRAIPGYDLARRMMKRFLLAAFLACAQGQANAGDHGDIIVFQIDRDIIGKIVLKPVEVIGPLWGDIGHGVFAERRTAHHPVSSAEPGYRMEDRNTNPAFCKGLKFSISASSDTTLRAAVDYSGCKESIREMLRQTQADDLIDGIAAAILHTNNQHKLRYTKIRMEAAGVRAQPVVRDLEWEHLRKRYKPLYRLVREK